MLCLHARLFTAALWSPAGKGMTSWLSFVKFICDVVTFPLVSWVRCGAWLYRFLIFALFLSLIWKRTVWHSDGAREKIFRKCEFWIKSADVIKAWKITKWQIAGIPMGTNCAPLVAALFLFWFEWELMLSLTRIKLHDVAQAFNSTSRYLDDLLNIDNSYFEQMISQIIISHWTWVEHQK